MSKIGKNNNKEPKECLNSKRGRRLEIINSDAVLARRARIRTEDRNLELVNQPALVCPVSFSFQKVCIISGSGCRPLFVYEESGVFVEHVLLARPRNGYPAKKMIERLMRAIG